ncbi:MAG: Pterin binding enzyme, partial [Acidimicrobiaceae bacterium]|nr:Pterin binding enzyme [Acidimicrobiaceae bacterium]
MLLALGDRRYDVARRALVLGAVASSNVFDELPPLGEVLTSAERALAEGADALTIPAREGVGSVIAALRRRYDVPLGVAAARRDRLVAAFDAGATVAIVNGQRAELLDVVERAGASVILVAPQSISGRQDIVECLASAAARAMAAGIPAARTIVDIGMHGRTITDAARRRLDAVPALIADGHLVAVDTLFRDCPSTAAVVAAAVVRGCRLVAATDVRA